MSQDMRHAADGWAEHVELSGGQAFTSRAWLPLVPANPRVEGLAAAVAQGMTAATNRVSRTGRLSGWYQRRVIDGFLTLVAPITESSRPRCRLHRVAEAGEAYDEGDLVVCLADGTPVHPKTLSRSFEREVKRAGLSSIRLHEPAAHARHAGCQIQMAMDVHRVLGNNAVHPGERQLDENPETVGALFVLLNTVVDGRVAQPRQIEDLYNALPVGAREAIARRDDRG